MRRTGQRSRKNDKQRAGVTMRRAYSADDFSSLLTHSGRRPTKPMEKTCRHATQPSGRNVNQLRLRGSQPDNVTMATASTTAVAATATSLATDNAAAV